MYSSIIYLFIHYLFIIYQLSSIYPPIIYHLSSVCPSVHPSVHHPKVLGKPYCTGEYSHGFSCEPTCAKYSMRHWREQQVWDSGGRPEPGQCTLLAQCLSLRSKCQARERQGLDVGLRIWNVDDGDTQKVWLGKPIPSP